MTHAHVTQTLCMSVPATLMGISTSVRQADGVQL